MSSLNPKFFVRRGFTLAMILATLTILASFVSGCVSTTPKALKALPAPTIRALAQGNGNQNNPWIITIHFQNAASCTITHVTEDNAKCPTVPGPGFCILRNKFVQWESDPAGIKYDIYFDPIQGMPLMSTPNGILFRKIDANAPFSLYKYSILKDGCNSESDTYDPYMRVDD